MWKARIAVPERVDAGDIVEIKTLVAHPMESGFRRDHMGREVPRDILEHFSCRIDGEVVFAADLYPAIAANPYLTFTVRIDRTSTIELVWRDQRGNELVERRVIEAT